MACIFFDCFGVLCAKCLLEWTKSVGLPENKVGQALTFADQVDSGEIELDKFHALLAELSGQTAVQVERDLLAHVRLNDQVVALAERLSAKHRVEILSNVNAAFLAAIIFKEDRMANFNPIIASSALRLMKPDPAIFRAALSLADCAGEEVVFIDDTAGHVEAAKNLGITGIHFQSAEQLERDLRRLNLL